MKRELWSVFSQVQEPQLCPTQPSQPAPYCPSVQLWRNGGVHHSAPCLCSAGGQLMLCLSPARVHGLPVSTQLKENPPRPAVPSISLQVYSLCNEIALLGFGCIYFLYRPLFFGLNIFSSFNTVSRSLDP